MIVGAILAGGMSTRMGAPKSELKLHGRPVIDVLVEYLRMFCPSTVIVCRDGLQASTINLPPNVSSICDSESGKGPLGGLHGALAWARTDSVLLLGCDVPFVEPALLMKLVHRFQHDQPIAVLPRTPDPNGGWQPQPLCSIWSPRSLPEVGKALRENRLSLFRLAQEIGAAYMDVSPEESTQLRNVNTREDLRDGLTL
ncbi:MAG TPA: molybdenum cofactor guanylyltransferase [Planctomycetota bacterium]|nr:molybdenum cofactor guanylyltransferase [Planctomycetota bacterium]